ncbi:hypothetical protein HOK51_03075 [Candidatus Woesearchaeota archaeon]|jgi:hypothetical protein|nr:hypothetical protein [Candidatus Woesearchaeota archaeon]MBT6518801.1 hypothetical protein [Candidatus Woesearchaeota archaeon]MBT7367940.1 hypothetical protein [Candidatus Woesearchaeota archaeon]
MTDKKSDLENKIETSVSIPDERVRTEQELRQEVMTLNSQYTELKEGYDSIIAGITQVMNSFGDELSQIRKYEREKLEDTFQSREKEILEFMLKQGDETNSLNEVKGLELLSEEEQTMCKATYLGIAMLTHPDKLKGLEQEDVEKYSELFKEAAYAYKEGNMFILQMIKKEIESGIKNATNYLKKDADLLNQEKTELEYLISQLKQHMTDMEVSGLKIKEFTSEKYKFNQTQFKTKFGSSLRKKLEKYLESRVEQELDLFADKIDEKKKDKIEEPKSSALISVPKSQDLELVDDETREKIMRSQIKNLITKFDRLSEYYKGFEGSGLLLKLLADESEYAKKISISHDVMGEHSIELNNGTVKGNLIRIETFITNFASFSLDSDGKIEFSKAQLESYASNSNVFSVADEILNKPIRALQVGHRGEYWNILGGYEEHDNKWIREDLRISNVNEIAVTRILRTLALLKIPRLRKWAKHKELHVFDEEICESHKYDGSSGSVKIDDVVDMTVSEYDKESKEHVERKIHGTVFEFEDERIEDETYNRLLACSEVEFSGEFELGSKKVPFYLKYNSPSSLNSKLFSIKDGYGAAKIEIRINNKQVLINYKNSGRKNTGSMMTVSGMDEDLLPDLMFKIVENLKVTKVKGKLYRKEIEYM